MTMSYTYKTPRTSRHVGWAGQPELEIIGELRVIVLEGGGGGEGAGPHWNVDPGVNILGHGRESSGHTPSGCGQTSSFLTNKRVNH
jgi:hypothetical protein